MKLHRRDFLKSGAAGIGSGMIFGSLPFENIWAAPKNPNHFFVQIVVSGGWDVTLATDPWTEAVRPKETDLFIEYKPSDVLSVTPEMSWGPAMSPLLPFAANISVVNGILAGQSDNGHTAHQIYMTTGAGNGTRPESAVHLAECVSEGPLGVLASGGRPYLAGSKQMVTDLSALSGVTGSASDQLLIEGDASAVEQAKKVLRDQGPLLKSMKTREAELKELLKNDLPTDDFNLTHLPLMFAAFTVGLADMATLSLNANNGLDTHANHVGAHMTGLKGVIEKLALLMKLMKSVPFGVSGENLLDRTTFYVTSEFSRTPALNTSGGKDHNPLTNSALLMGRGVKGGRSVGASRLIAADQSEIGASYHIASGFDFATQAPVSQRTADTSVILPENLIVTLEKIFQVPASWSNLQLKGFKPLSSLY